MSLLLLLTLPAWAAPDALFDNARLRSASVSAPVPAAPVPAPGPGRRLEPPIEEIAGSDWRAVGRVEDSYREGDPAAREKEEFWDKLRNSGFWGDLAEQACREVRFPAKAGLGLADAARVKPAFERFLRRAPDGRFLLVDRMRLAASLGRTFHVAELAGGAVPVHVTAGAEIDGTSQVVRLLEGKSACRQVDDVLDLREAKAALPLSAERFAAMAEGEIWSVPLRLRAWIGAGVSGSVEGVPVSLSFGYSREGGASVTLRRLSPSELRVRLRFDYVNAYGPGGALAFRVAGAEFERFRSDGREWSGDLLGSTLGESGLWRVVDGPLRRQAERYLTAQLGFLAQWTREDHALVELVLDPRDTERMRALEEFLAGGDLAVLDSLAKLAGAAGSLIPDRRAMGERLEALGRAHDAAFGTAPGFSGAERVESFLTALRLKVPLVVDAGWSTGTRDERVTLHDGSGGRYDVYRAHSERSAGFIDVPFLGRVVDTRSRRSVMSFAYRDARGASAVPALVYVHQEGYTMVAQPQARSLAVEMDSMMRLAGTRGRGENGRAGLPLARVFPSKELPPAETGWRPPGSEDSWEGPREPIYRRGMGAFTLALGEKALSDALAATVEDVVRSYVRVMAEGAWFGEALELAVGKGRIRNDGSVEYGPSVYAHLAQGEDFRERQELDEVVSLTLRYGKKLVERLGRIRASPPARRAEALRDLVAGSVGWGLSYERLMKVLVQLVDPAHLSAEFVVAAQPYDRGLGSVEGRYLFRRGLDQDPALRRLGETVSRFSGPSQYSD